MDASVAVPAVISLVGMAGSFAGWWLGRRDAKKETRALKADTEAQAKRMNQLVDAAREQVDRAGRLVAAAERQAAAAQRSASSVESIASVLAPQRLSVEWQSHGQFRLRNSSATAVAVEAFIRPEAFLRAPFEVPVTIPPGESIGGTALDALGLLFPGELMLDLAGEDEPCIVSTAGRPPKS